MKSLIGMIVWLAMAVFTLMGTFKVMAWMQVQDNVRVSLYAPYCGGEAVKVVCSRDGLSLGRTLTGDVRLIYKDAPEEIVPYEAVAGYITDSSHYRPFGKAFAMIVSIVLLMAGMGVWPLISMLRKKRKMEALHEGVKGQAG